MTDATLIHELPGSREQPTAVTGRHLPALNGLRAAAVIGVVAYHLQFGWASGGYLGVDLFFVLSGFLITTLLLEEWAGTGRVDLAAFWGRRARRLLPALFLVVGALALYLILNAHLGGPGSNGLIDLSGLRGDAISTLLYVNNWHSIFTHQSYFAQFSTPSPLQHTWSLAIEEQFYLVWPLVLLLLLRLAPARLAADRRGPHRQPGDPVVGPHGRPVPPGGGSHPGLLRDRHPALRPDGRRDRRLRRRLAPATQTRGPAGPCTSLAPVAAVALGVFWVTAGTPGGLPTNFMFEGGFLLCAGLAALVVADARLVEPGWFSRALAWHPLHFIGTISYGIYLWHWPVIVYLNGARTGLSTWPLDLLRIAVTLAVSTASYYLVERPIRLAHLRGWVRWWGAPLAGVVSAVVIVVATIPAVADPSSVVGTTHLATTGRPVRARLRRLPGPAADPPHDRAVAGRSPARHAPRRLGHARRLLRDHRRAPGDRRGHRRHPHHRRLRPDGGHELAHVDPQPHPPDPGPAHRRLVELGPVRADHAQRAAPAGRSTRGCSARPWRRCSRPGNGVEGVIFTEFPQSGPIPASNPADQAAYNKERRDGVVAWNAIAAKMTSYFPGRVMYFPLADSVLLARPLLGLAPARGRPARAAAEHWIRVRKLDKVHLCPEGSARYGDALLTDMTAVFGLAPATGDWSQGSWTSDPNFNDPPGACPDDHPPGR